MRQTGSKALRRVADRGTEDLKYIYLNLRPPRLFGHYTHNVLCPWPEKCDDRCLVILLRNLLGVKDSGCYVRVVNSSATEGTEPSMEELSHRLAQQIVQSLSENLPPSHRALIYPLEPIAEDR